MGLLRFISISILLFVVAIGSTLSNSWATQAKQSIIVTVSGESSGGKNTTIDQVEQAAIADAKRNALEQAGTVIQSESQVELFQLTKDQIKTFSEGLVKVLEITDKKIVFDENLKAFNAKVTIKAEVMILEASELLKKFQQSTQAESQLNKPPLAFHFNIIARKASGNGQYEEVLVRDGSTLYSGNEFQIHFTPSQDCYVYIVNIDARDQLYTLLPNDEGIKDNLLKANTDYILPGANKFYQLDDAKGIETIYVIASYAKMEDVEYVMAKAKEQKSPSSELFNSAVRSRGISKIVQGDSKSYPLGNGMNIKKIEEIIKGETNVVRIVQFMHQ